MALFKKFWVELKNKAFGLMRTEGFLILLPKLMFVWLRACVLN